MHEWNEATQRAFLGHLANATELQPPVREQDLWIVTKGERQLRCIAVYLPHGIDLRLMDADGFRRTELFRDAPTLQARAQEWRAKLRERGWA